MNRQLQFVQTSVEMLPEVAAYSCLVHSCAVPKRASLRANQVLLMTGSEPTESELCRVLDV